MSFLFNTSPISWLATVSKWRCEKKMGDPSSPEMVADAAKSFSPKILYPYHFGETDTSKLVNLLKDTPGIEVRIRKMK